MAKEDQWLSDLRVNQSKSHACMLAISTIADAPPPKYHSVLYDVKIVARRFSDRDHRDGTLIALLVLTRQSEQV